MAHLDLSLLAPGIASGRLATISILIGAGVYIIITGPIGGLITRGCTKRLVELLSIAQFHRLVEPSVILMKAIWVKTDTARI